MESLEGTTVALIHRRRLRSFHQGYVMLVMLMLLMLLLPFVKTDVVCNAGGMLRPAMEPLLVQAPMSGRVGFADLEEGRQLRRGDTLLVYTQEDRLLRLQKLNDLLEIRQEAMSDIESLLRGSGQVHSKRYMEEKEHYQEEVRLLEIQTAYLREEYLAAQKLFDEKVIPVLEYEKARMAYEASCSRTRALGKRFRNRLEEEYFLMDGESMDYRSQIMEIRAAMAAVVLQSPVDGTLHHCAGISAGSQVGAGMQLGTILPESPLLAECLVRSRDIVHVHRGMPVKLHFDISGQSRGSGQLLHVDHIGPDAVLVDGKSMYRVRCLPDPDLAVSEEWIPGMNFSASLVLYRSSLGAILLRKTTGLFRPAHAG